MANLPEPGTFVQLKTATQSFSGMLLPQESEVVVLKLNSGYNIGILPQHILSCEIDNSAKKTLPKKEITSPSQSADLPTVALLHTGGTIASKVDYTTGAVVADFDPASLLELFPELASLAHIKSTFLGNMFSDDFRFGHFNTIIRAVKEQLDAGIKKIIVTSGTDFLHYLSAGLSFAFKETAVSLLVVGSQRSSDRGSSDAGMNLVCATQFLVHTDFQGVGICMHASSSDDVCHILPGVNARKMHSSRRDAFKSINTKPLALVDYASKKVTLLQELAARKTTDNTVVLYDESLKIGLCYSHPQMYAQELLAYKDFSAVVLAGSGLGHFPCTAIDSLTEEHKAIYAAIQKLAETFPVVMSTQTLHGKINLHVYTQGRRIQEAGVLGNYSAMTPETTFMKVAHLLSAGSKDFEKELMTNFVGEHDIETFDAYEE
jgi:glutamyl-tRNA(Gln) amidotransferase subunit D